MKGVINKGVQELVERRFGHDAWEAICHEAGCGETAFAPSLDYPDQLTIDLIHATAAHADMAPDDVMVEFGKHWIQHTGRQTYPTLFMLAGNNPRDFLARMGRVHAQATQSIQGARPPMITGELLPHGGLALHYVSERKLCPVVLGLILGVGIHFGQALGIEETECTRRGDSSCTFAVRFP